VSVVSQPDPFGRPALQSAALSRADGFGRVLNTPLCVTSHEAFGRRCLVLAREARPVAAEFTNTHIVTLRRHDPAYRELTSCYDYFVPDATPLVWCLNRLGAGLRDRVYGPAFMRHFLTTSPPDCRHYLLGGSAECGLRLAAAAREWNPGIQIVGSAHDRCLPDGTLEGTAEARVLEELRELKPDIIWVGLGTPKQDAWVQRHKPRLSRGVILSVGFAFDVNAGMKPDAPPWMQGIGLTWLFRLASEPRRLFGRYLKYNSLFLWYLLWDGLRGRAFAPAQDPDRSQE
jgi:N-acetylglucosaminyldiphosphoundecaprenol N-acetyl-beta-D-mannosaminyltransferase